MTATERLRQLLDERGVEWEGEEANSIIHDGKFLYTYWCKGMHCFTEPIGAKEGTLGALTDFSASGFTPEQAVDATLGREPNDKEMLRLHDRLNVALLRLERNVDNGNERIAAIAEAHELLEDAATLGRGTCEDELREALTDLWPRASFTMCPENRESWLERLAELGVEVEL